MVCGAAAGWSRGDYGVRAGLLGEDQKKKGKIERNKNKIFYLLNIIGIIYGPWASGGPGQVPLLPWLRAGPDL